MIVSVADLIAGRVGHSDGAGAPNGGRVGRETLAGLLRPGLAEALPGHGAAYLKRLVSVLDTPLPRILVTGWGSLEEFRRFAPSPDAATGESGEVDLFDFEVMARWEIAALYGGMKVRGPRLIVGLTVGVDTGAVVIRDGSVTELKASALRYDAVLLVKGASREIARVAPRQVELPGGRLDFGHGWPVRPSEPTRSA